MKDPKLNGAGRSGIRHIDRLPAPPRPVIGLEAEFTLFVNDVERRPEDVFGTPAKLIGQPMIPRTGKSFQLPSGGAIYFDTGVIEVATPIIELGRAAAIARRVFFGNKSDTSGRSSMHGARATIAVAGSRASARITTSPSRPRVPRVRATSSKLGFLLTHILPIPTLLLAANRKSSAIGVRPRGTGWKSLPTSRRMRR